MFSRMATIGALAMGVGLTIGEVQGASESDSPRNIVLIVSDDHRYDFFGFMGHPAFLETPTFDRMASEGMHLKNAFVSTSLCSPSRASILTGQYMHRHGVVDNQRPVPERTLFFPELLQEVGYNTAFVGKWHMGEESAEPRPGFDHWVSFRGQGEYHNPSLNVNGESVKREGYMADILTGEALEWLEGSADHPFFLQLCYKAVHYPFEPAPRHEDRYSKSRVTFPETMAKTEENYRSQSRWIKERRYSIHGIEHMFTGPFDSDPVPSLEGLYRQYSEAVYGLDENVGRVLDFLDEQGLSEETLVLYLGDNGFALGEHGFYDKRDAFEESIRIPMLAYAPGMIDAGSEVDEMVQNIDIAPTLVEMAGAEWPAGRTIDGRSFLPLLQGRETSWREAILYEYYWEWNFPATPTLFALRSDRFKYIFYHGIWDRNGFYDLKTDPLERHNLIDVPAYEERIRNFRERLFDRLEATGGMQIPLKRPRGVQYYDRRIEE